jgi:hypothetical protein
VHSSKFQATRVGTLFGKQKVYKNNKEVMNQVQDPIIYFAFAFATDEEPEELLARVDHEWHNHVVIF